MKMRILHWTSLAILPLAGCGPTVDPDSAILNQLEKRPFVSMTTVKPSHKLTVDQLAARGLHGLFVRVAPENLERFKTIESQGLSLDVDREHGTHGFLKLKVRLAPKRAAYASAAGRESLLAIAKGDAIVIVDFGPVPGSGTFSEVVPIFRSDVAAVSITLDLHNIEASGEFTDVANEFFSTLVAVNDYRAFWTENLLGRTQLNLEGVQLTYFDLARQETLSRLILAAESEVRRERYLDWVKQNFTAFDRGTTGEFHRGAAPGYMRPFEIRTGRLAKDNAFYHRPRFIQPKNLDEVVYCTIKAGKNMRGEQRVFYLPYVPPRVGEQEADTISLGEYKARWYSYFKKDILAEGQYSPYSYSLHPHHARFPDHATPPSFFSQGFKQALKKMKRALKMREKITPDVVAKL